MADPEAATVVERPHPLTGLARSTIAFFAALLFVGQQALQGELGDMLADPRFPLIVGGILLAVVLFNLVWGLFEWRTTTFVVGPDEFRIDRTLVQKNSQRIAYSKIQSVEIDRELMARILGLAAVRIDVGGSGGAKLQYLGHARANALRDVLLARTRHLTPITAPSDESAATPTASPEGRVLVRVRPGTLLRGTLISMALPWLFGLVALGVGLSWAGGAAALASVGAALLGVLGWIWKELAGNWDFHLSEVPTGVHVRRGMFTKVTRSMRADRIQAVRIDQDFLQRLGGLYKVRVTVLGGASEPGEAGGVVLPYGTWDEVQQVLAAFWPGIDIDTIEPHSYPSRAHYLTPFTHPNNSWGVDSQTVVTHRGWLHRGTRLIPHRRVQSLSLHQGPLQRRLDLATVRLHAIDGPVEVSLRHLDGSLARSFLDEEHQRARRARLSPATYLSELPPPSPEAAARVGP